MTSKQNVLKVTKFIDSNGEYSERTEIVIPKVINSDVSFQLMFGLHYPFEKVNNYIGKDPYYGIPESYK